MSTRGWAAHVLAITCASAQLLALSSLVASCRSRPRVEETAARETDAQRSLPTSADRLRMHELAEGPEDAFGLPIPRDMRVERRFVNVVAARSTSGAIVRADTLTSYIERHVTGGTIEIANQRTTFRNAGLKNGTIRSELQIEIVSEPASVLLTIRDETKPEPLPGLDESERWRRAGFDPSGKLTDPAQQQ